VKLDAKGFPAFLKPVERCQVMLGYYHQRASLEGGDKVKLALTCKAFGKNVEQVAMPLGITSSALRARVQGNLTVKSLQQVADAIGCEVTDLIP